VATLEGLRWKVEGEGGAAEVLGINPSTLRTRMRKHGIQRPKA
jgi:formate hydrogenlyase transcriptional activator